MAKRLQHRGGTTSQHSTFTGAVREVTVDTDKNTLVVHDGATAGGHPLATATNFTSTGIDDNATSTAITIDSSERVGIGTASPDNLLHLTPSQNSTALQIANTSDTNGIRINSGISGLSSNSLQFLNQSGDSLLIIDGNSKSTMVGNIGPSGYRASFGDFEVKNQDGAGNPGGTLVLSNTDGSILSGQHLGNLTFASYDQSGATTTGGVASIRAVASETYGSTSGASLLFYTHPSSANNGTVDGNMSERVRINNSGNVGINTTSPSALLDLGGAGSSYQSGQEKITIAQSPSPYGYYPSLSSHNRSYLHLTGSGGGSAFNTSIHGYQVANPAGGSYMRVASGLTNNYVFYHKTDVTGFKWYADYNKSSGDADFTPSEEVSFNFETDTGAIVFNESSRDRDFRVESNNNTHMLFVDGGKDAVAIGASDAHQSPALNVTQLDDTKPIQVLRGSDAADGARVRSMKILRHIPVVSLGTKLIIPFISQSSFNVNSLITLRGKTAEYNTGSAKAFEVLFQVGSVTSLNSFSVLRSGGTYSSATTNGMNVEITFNTNYTHATEDGVIIEMDILCERIEKSVDIDAIVMN